MLFLVWPSFSFSIPMLWTQPTHNLRLNSSLLNVSWLPETRPRSTRLLDIRLTKCIASNLLAILSSASSRAIDCFINKHKELILTTLISIWKVSCSNFFHILTNNWFRVSRLLPSFLLFWAIYLDGLSIFSALLRYPKQCITWEPC